MQPGRVHGRAVPTPMARSRVSLPTSVPRLSKVSRKSSAMGRNTLKTDPRPLKDPDFVAEQQGLVADFLASRGADRGLGTKALSAPSSKEFGFIFSGLLRALDPRPRNVPHKIEDQVPNLLRRLRYPFQVSAANASFEQSDAAVVVWNDAGVPIGRCPNPPSVLLVRRTLGRRSWGACHGWSRA